MPCFTFIAEFDGGTFICQKKNNDLMSALKIWATEELDRFTNQSEEKEKTLKNLQEEKPTEIEGATNVWHCHEIIEEKSLFLNIVQTEEIKAYQVGGHNSRGCAPSA